MGLQWKTTLKWKETNRGFVIPIFHWTHDFREKEHVPQKKNPRPSRSGQRKVALLTAPGRRRNTGCSVGCRAALRPVLCDAVAVEAQGAFATGAEKSHCQMVRHLDINHHQWYVSIIPLTQSTHRRWRAPKNFTHIFVIWTDWGETNKMPQLFLQKMKGLHLCCNNLVGDLHLQHVIIPSFHHQCLQKNRKKSWEMYLHYHHSQTTPFWNSKHGNL